MQLTEKTNVFISDLHIDSEKPQIAEQFIAFCEGLKASIKYLDALYILGDWFESWVGEDDPDKSKWQAIRAVKEISDLDVPCFFMAGNRDFLIGDEFAKASGCEVLADPAIVSLYGKKVVLMHGDTLCTDDVEYQKFRALSRSDAWQAQIKQLPLEQRIGMAAQIREQSMQDTASKDNDIMDVNQQAVLAAFAEHDVDTIIHGHTHRPAIHRIEKQETELTHEDVPDMDFLTRIVLGDWYEQGSVLLWRKKDFDLKTMAR